MIFHSQGVQERELDTLATLRHPPYVKVLISLSFWQAYQGVQLFLP
jgi:hypothetical protein